MPKQKKKRSVLASIGLALKSPKNRIIVVALSFALVGGCVMVFRSFAATDLILQYNAAEAKLQPSNNSRYIQQDLGNGKGSTTAVQLQGVNSFAIAGAGGNIDLTNAKTKFFKICIVGSQPNPDVYIRLFYHPRLSMSTVGEEFNVLPSTDLKTGYHESCTPERVVDVTRPYFGSIVIRNNSSKAVSFTSLSLYYISHQAGGTVGGSPSPAK